MRTGFATGKIHKRLFQLVCVHFKGTKISKLIGFVVGFIVYIELMRILLLQTSKGGSAFQ